MSKIEKCFKLLQSGRMSGLAIGIHTNSRAVGSLIADLRKKGCDVRRYYMGKSKRTNAERNDYELLSWPVNIYA